MKGCALYARVSLEEQAERFGLSSQLSELRAYAAKQGYEVKHDFVDDGYSGADLGRPELTKLRDLVRGRSIDGVIVHDPDRLARKLAHQMILTDEFEKFGVRLEFLSTPNTDSTEGRLLLNVRGVIAEYEREKIRERTMRGRREKARQGLIVGGRSPYGYELVQGRYQVDISQSQVILAIFQWLVEERLSIRQIVERLNTSGYKPHTASRWAKSSVARILRHELYTGRGYYNRRQRIEPETSTSLDFRRNKKTIHRWRAQAEWIPQSVPTIISADLFAAAQLRLKENSEHCCGRPSNTIYLLRGILKCSSCGRKYAGVPIFKDKYYRCTGRERLARPHCDAPPIAASRIESFIWDYVVRLLSNPVLLSSKLAQQEVVNKPNITSEVARLETEIREIERKEVRLMDAFLDGGIELPGMKGKATELATTRSQLIATRDAARKSLSSEEEKISLKEKVVRYCELLGSKVFDFELAAKQSLLRALVDYVTLDAGQITICTILPVSDPSIYSPQRAHDRPTRIR